MKITVAIPAYHFNERLMACINAIRNQRVIQADAIKVYDVNMSAELASQVEQEGCEVLTKFKYADFKETYLIAGIIDVNAEGLVKFQFTRAVGFNFLPEVTDITCIFTLTEHKGCAGFIQNTECILTRFRKFGANFIFRILCKLIVNNYNLR